MGRRTKADPAAELEAELSRGEGLKERTLTKVLDMLDQDWTAPEQELISVARRNIEEVIRQIGEAHGKAKE